MRLLRSITLILVSVLFFQCQKEVSNIGGPDPVIVLPDPIAAKLQGNILDENGQPAAGVTVTVGSQTATTNASGYFSIFNAALDKKASLVTAEKSGYFKAYRTFSATDGTNQVVIKLIKKTLTGTIDAATGGNVTLANGAKIALPANSVVKAAGSVAYTGTINVYAAYIDPTASDIDQTVPGSFMANDINGSRVTLSSYGMMAVELESAAAEKLQIKSGSVATLTTPIPSSIQSSAPATIALWSVDETTGIWKEEGTATKSGNNYVGDVKHFSFWNCDISIPAIQLSMTIKNPNGQPLVHALVRIKRTTTTNPSQTHGWTDTLGKVSGLVPANEILILQILDPCHNVIYSQNIGPFSVATNLGVITVTIPATGLLTFTGHLTNCSGGNVTSGYAIIYFNNSVRYAAVNASGNFTTHFIVCSSSPTTAQVLGVDSTTQQQGNLTPVTVTTPNTNAGNITACGNSSVQYINYTIDGTNYVVSSSVGDSLAAFTGNLQGTTILQTMISGSHLNNHIAFKFNHPTAVAGTYAVLQFNVNQNASTTSTVIPPFNVIITNYPLVIGQFYEGSFSGSYSNTTGTHTASGTFRVRKNN